MEYSPNSLRSPRFTFEQIIVLCTMIAGLAGATATIQSTLMYNRSLLEEMSMTMHLIRTHQINNEALIDQHSADLQEIQRAVGMPVRIYRKALADPVPQ